MNKQQRYDALVSQIKVFSETIWEGKASEASIIRWLGNFDNDPSELSDDKLVALYLLSRFTYLGSREIKEALKAIYRDLAVYPVVESIRKRMNDSIDLSAIQLELKTELESTVFLAAGNPSESGAHLLYFFRQENGLGKNAFIHAMEAFSQTLDPDGRHQVQIANPDIKRYVFIDDFCGTGKQAVRYAAGVVTEIRRLAPHCSIDYFVLAGTTEGLNHVRSMTSFDRVDSVIELDDSFKCFHPSSRYFEQSDEDDRTASEELARRFGKKLNKNHPLGHDGSQLLVSFTHNTPNNTLPIFWANKPSVPWLPIFRRYPKRM